VVSTVVAGVDSSSGGAAEPRPCIRSGSSISLEAKPPSGVARYIPVLQWLPKYRGSYAIGDLIAATTVWALLIPESMAYASVAGIPVQYGLYAATLAGFAYMIFGASRRFFGPDSAPAAVSAGVVAGVVGANATPDHHIAATAALTLLVGVIFIVLGLLGLDWVSKFFAQPALTGFVFGLGWFIAVGQLPKLVGIHKRSGDTVKILFDTVIHIGDWNWYAVGVGRVALAALFAASRFVPKVPRPSSSRSSASSPSRPSTSTASTACTSWARCRAASTSRPGPRSACTTSTTSSRAPSR
jgi:MFS superfamily sulfate permease-like transporter